MALRIEVLPTRLSVYYAPWFALTLAVFACTASLGMAWLFGSFTDTQPAFWFFAVVFGLVGLVVLTKLPEQIVRTLRGEGAIVFQATNDGIEAARAIGAPRTVYPWSSVKEIHLVEKLKLVESGDTTWISGAIIIFLQPACYQPGSLIERARSGIAVTGKRQPYLILRYPKDEQETTIAGLSGLAPAGFPVVAHPNLTFKTYSGELQERRQIPGA